MSSITDQAASRGPEPTADALRRALPSRAEIFDTLAQIVSYPSVFVEEDKEDARAAAAEWTSRQLAARGFEVEEHATRDGSIAVLGRRGGAEGAPTVLLYSHYDVVPAGDPAAWTTPPFELSERDGRWWGRGAADCKGNIAMHLAALDAVAATGLETPNLIVLVEGSEEAGGAGLDDFIDRNPGLVEADAILIADTGNAAVGVPTLTTSLRGGAQLTVTVDTLAGPMHSGMFGGAAPDAVFALIKALSSLRDGEGRTVIDGVDGAASWEGEPYGRDAFRRDAGVLDGVRLTGAEDEDPADYVWARPAVTVTGFTSTPVKDAVNAVPARAEAKINLRVPAGVDAADTAEKLAEHIRRHTPWGAHVQVTIEDINDGFTADMSRPGLALLGRCLAEAYGAAGCSTIGAGGSIPLTLRLQEAHPEAEIALFGVEEPRTTIHAVDESVDPSEIESIAVAEALFLARYGRI